MNLTWTASTDNIAVDHYEVERSSNHVSFSLIGSPATATYSDSTVSSSTTYLYRIRAVDAAGNKSGYSNVDLATTFIFADDPIVTQSTIVKAQHFTDLFTAVNAVRATAGLPALNWSTTDRQGNSVLPPAIGNPVKAQHIIDLRSNLNQALTSLGFLAPSYTDPNLTTGASGTLIKGAHVQELRQAVK